MLDHDRGLVRGQVTPDRLGRPGECRIGVDERPRDDCTHGSRGSDLGEAALQGVEQNESDRSLRLCPAPVQRDGRDDRCGDLVLDQQVSHLRPVAVRDRHLVAVGGDGRDPAGGQADRGDLVLGVARPPGAVMALPPSAISTRTPRA